MGASEGVWRPRSMVLPGAAKQMKDVPNAGIIARAAGTFVPTPQKGHVWGIKRFVSPSGT
ncbi:hypothetical protein GCM10011487_04180 [Steroidobacter agaridevorans]|uniref:Uncharacterized protein n=1 Tax=Steroidobacter agaridevorans TaxID=2695856 RepID=A0A829Y664_9GAMM|nr:hypothetical protein GCM10011487_04180 [Steroidobacter agaridevorans]